MFLPVIVILTFTNLGAANIVQKNGSSVAWYKKTTLKKPSYSYTFMNTTYYNNNLSSSVKPQC